jgi:hypothetical protein
VLKNIAINLDKLQVRQQHQPKSQFGNYKLFEQ